MSNIVKVLFYHEKYHIAFMKLSKSNILVKASTFNLINVIFLKFAERNNLEWQMDALLIQFGGLLTLMSIVAIWVVYLFKIDIETKN